MNGRFLGGGMKMAPMQYRMSDKLSCIAVHNAGRLKVLLLFLTIFKGNHIKHKSLVDWCQGHEITVKFDRPVSMQIDGEVYTNITSYRATKAKQEVTDKNLVTTSTEC
jgi:diacylglycerol kinase family enzyme